jgi:DNA primase
MDVKAIDAVGYLRDRNIPYYTEGENCREGWVNIRCLFCDDDSNHLGINEDSNTISCWRCRTKGTILKIAMKLERKSLENVWPVLEKFKRRHFGTQDNTNSFSSRLIPVKGIKSFPPIPHDIAKFLNTRNLSTGNFLRHAEGWTGPYHEYPCKIAFPIKYQKRTVSYVMRDFTGNSKIKYVNYPDDLSEIPSKNLLYGYDDAPDNSTLIGVEGIFDKLKLGRRAVAFLGVGFTKQQVLCLHSKHPKKVYILFDSEPQAQRLAKDLAKTIWFCPTEVIELKNFKDPGDMSESEGMQLINQLT